MIVNSYKSNMNVLQSLNVFKVVEQLNSWDNAL